jgi:hypothetical protein
MRNDTAWMCDVCACTYASSFQAWTRISLEYVLSLEYVFLYESRELTLPHKRLQKNPPVTHTN